MDLRTNLSPNCNEDPPTYSSNKFGSNESGGFGGGVPSKLQQGGIGENYNISGCENVKSDGKYDGLLQGPADKSEAANLPLPDYPTHGVIGTMELPRNLFNNQQQAQSDAKDFKLRKFDYQETYEKNAMCNGAIQNATPPTESHNVDLLQGYGCQRPQHPFYRTTSSDYGKLAPTEHDVSNEYYGLKSGFTSHLALSGMPRNRSLNIK